MPLRRNKAVGALPPPDVRQLCRAARHSLTRRLASRCLADCSAAPRLAGEWASTTTCCRSSACCSPTTACPWLMLYYVEMLPRVRAAGCRHAVAREGPWQCGCPWRANPARRADLAKGARAQCGASGGRGARAWRRVGGRGSLWQGGPVPPPVVRVAIARFWLLLPDSVRRRLQKMRLCAWCCCRGTCRHHAAMVRVILHLRPARIPMLNSAVLVVYSDGEIMV